MNRRQVLGTAFVAPFMDMDGIAPVEYGTFTPTWTGVSSSPEQFLGVALNSAGPGDEVRVALGDHLIRNMEFPDRTHAGDIIPVNSYGLKR